MEKHPSGIFRFDNKKNLAGYEKLNNQFDNSELKIKCFNKIQKAVDKHHLDLGIDFSKPWEEIEYEEVFQIEYLFVGEILNENSPLIDDEIGITINPEKTFGKNEFNDEDILSLIFIIPKQAAANSSQAQ